MSVTHTYLPNGWRKVNIIDNLISFLTTYVKSRSNTNLDDLIPHALPYDLSIIAIMYFTAITPTAVALAPMRYSNPEYCKDVKNTMKYFVFHQSGIRMTSEKFGETLATVLHEYTGYRIGISEWRHFNKCIGRAIAAGFTTWDAEMIRPAMEHMEEDYIQQQVEEVMNNQFGHSSGISTLVYAVPLDRFPTVKPKQFEGYQGFSRYTHRFWDLPNPHDPVPMHVQTPGQGTGAISEDYGAQLTRVRSSFPFIVLIPDQSFIETAKRHREGRSRGDCKQGTSDAYQLGHGHPCNHRSYHHSCSRHSHHTCSECCGINSVD